MNILVTCMSSQARQKSRAPDREARSRLGGYATVALDMLFELVLATQAASPDFDLW